MRSRAVLLLALVAAVDAAAFSRAYPIFVENKRAYDIVIEYSRYEAEDHARSHLWIQQQHQQGRVHQLKVRSRRSEVLSGDEYQPWMRWCQVEPPSSLPCEVLDVRRAVASRIIFE
jgi:hypothetical protein